MDATKYLPMIGVAFVIPPNPGIYPAGLAANGWYIGASMEHYRCHKIYVKKTRSERISDTVFFKHKYITQPTVTPADTIVKALNDLPNALKGKRNVKAEAQIEALEKIDELPHKMT